MKYCGIVIHDTASTSKVSFVCSFCSVVIMHISLGIIDVMCLKQVADVFQFVKFT